MSASDDVVVILTVSGPTGPAGTAAAGTVAYDDSATGLGATDVQAAIQALWQLIQAGGGPGGQLDFSKAANSGLDPVVL